MSYRRYIAVLFGGVGLTAALLLAVALWLQPYSGDMTRMGGFAENQFGWTGEQMEFTPALAKPYDHPRAYDVLVIGDSFSSLGLVRVQPSGGRYWTDHLAALSGATIGVGVRAVMPVDHYLKSVSFRDYPPRFLVIELVERNLARLSPATPADCQAASARPVSPIESYPLAAPSGAAQRPTQHPTIKTAIDEANDFIGKLLQRTVGLGDGTNVRRVALKRSNMFTSTVTDETLLFGEDFLKATWSEADFQRIACTMQSWQAAADANGFTQLLILIAPDKTTIYRPYFRDSINLPEFIPRLSGRIGEAVLRADLALGEAVASGQKDVYLPNDTHWGSAGARIVAEMVAGRIFVASQPKSAHPSPAEAPPRR